MLMSIVFTMNELFFIITFNLLLCIFLFHSLCLFDDAKLRAFHYSLFNLFARIACGGIYKFATNLANLAIIVAIIIKGKL